MRHARPHLQLDLAAGLSHPLGHAHRIVQQDLVAADLDQGRGQPLRVAVKRRGVRIAPISVAQITTHKEWHVVRVLHRVANSVARQRRAGHCQIGPGRQGYRRGRKRRAHVAQPQQQRQREAAAGGIPHHRAMTRLGSLGDESLPRRHRVIERRRERMLRCEAIVDCRDPCLRRYREAP